MFYKKGIKPWYQKRKGTNPRGDRYEHVGGDPKHWDLSECLRCHFGSDNPPELANLEFLIGLRNFALKRHYEHGVTHTLDGSGASADNSPCSAAEALKGTLVNDGKRLEMRHFCFAACASSVRQEVFAGPKSLDAPEP